jgi:hypothetical protein
MTKKQNTRIVRQPDSVRVQFAPLVQIPYYVQFLEAGLRALDLAAKYQPLSLIEIVVEGETKAADNGVLTVYAQTASSMAAVYSRLLLEFLGLRSGGNPSRLLPVVQRKDGDIGVEHYQKRDGTPLKMIAPSIVHEFPDAAEVERAWIVTCDFAGQRLAHLTDDYKLGHTDVTPMLRRAFETIPVLLSRSFLDHLR